MNKRGVAIPLILAIIFGISTAGLTSYIIYSSVTTNETQTMEESTSLESESINTNAKDNGNSSESIFDIVSNLAEEKAPSQAIDNSYKVKNITINNIDIYDEAYVAVSHDYWNNTLGMDVDTFKRLSDDSPESDNAKSGNLNGRQIEAIGKITWTVEYDKDLTNANISFAGGGQSQIYKNNLVESYIFYLYKDSAGKYELETGTGW